MKERYEVEIYLPRQGAPEDEPIAIMGYQEKADKCKAEICKIVSQLESFQTVEVEIDTRVHARLIGAKGKNLKRISDQYKVEIKFPGRNSSEPSKVTNISLFSVRSRNLNLYSTLDGKLAVQ